MILKDKKALEAEVLIGIIITILIAAVIFLFIRGLSLKGIIDREACHQSVVMRSLPAGIGEAMKRGIPLKCKTEDILINFEDEELIKQRIATAMYDCWWMLGDGKMDFFARPWALSEVNCVICSKISFSDATKSKYKKITGFTDYLRENKPAGNEKTYFKLFDVTETFSDNDLENQEIETGGDYALVFSLTEKSRFVLLAYEGTGCLMSFAIGAKVGAATAAIPIVGIYFAPTAAITTFVAGCGSSIWGAKGTDKWVTGGETYIAALNLIPYTEEGIKEFKCNKIESIP